MATHNVGTPVNAGDLVIFREYGRDKIQVTAVDPKAAPVAAGEHLAHNPSQIADAVQLRLRAFRGQLRSIPGLVCVDAIYKALAVIEGADNRSVVVDACRHGAERGRGHIHFVKIPANPHETVKVQRTRKLIRSYDIVVIVDTEYLRSGRSGEINFRIFARPVHESVEHTCGIEVRPGDHVIVVNPVRCGRDRAGKYECRVIVSDSCGCLGRCSDGNDQNYERNEEARHDTAPCGRSKDAQSCHESCRRGHIFAGE